MKTHTITVQRTEEGLRLNGYLCQIKPGRVVSIENYSVGIGHSAYPNIDKSGSVAGMKKLGYWGKDDKTVRQDGFIYNVSHVVISDPLDALALYIEKGGIFPTPAQADNWYKTTFTFTI